MIIPSPIARSGTLAPTMLWSWSLVHACCVLSIGTLIWHSCFPFPNPLFTCWQLPIDCPCMSYMWRVFCLCVPWLPSISLPFSLFPIPMDNHTDHTTSQLDVLPSWVPQMDILYSHALLLVDVPLDSEAVKLWLSHFVKFKLHNFCFVDFLVLTAI